MQAEKMHEMSLLIAKACCLNHTKLRWKLVEKFLRPPTKLGYDYKLLTRLWGAQHSSDGAEQSVNMANVNKKKKKKGDEAEIEVGESKISAETDTNAMII